MESIENPSYHPPMHPCTLEEADKVSKQHISQWSELTGQVSFDQVGVSGERKTEDSPHTGTPGFEV